MSDKAEKEQLSNLRHMRKLLENRIHGLKLDCSEWVILIIVTLCFLNMKVIQTISLPFWFT